MTAAPGRSSWRLLGVGGVLVAALGVVTAAGLDDTLVYYRTPTEVGQLAPATQERVRVGGLVAPGSVERSDAGLSFTLTDGVSDLLVTHDGTTPGVFQEGQGAVVEGRIDAGGVLRSDTLLVKHSNEYRPEQAGAPRP